MAHTYKYAILQLLPFAHREESINVGVVVFKESTLDIRLSAPVPILNYFGVQVSTLDWLASQLHNSDAPMSSAEERLELLSYIAGTKFSELGWFITDEPNEYEVRISEIISEYIEKPRQIRKKQKRTILSKELRCVFKEYKIFSNKMEDLDRHKVIANMPVGPSGKLHVDFLLKNSNFHATETLDFRKSEDAGPSELKNAALANVTFQHAREVLGPTETKCYLVYAASSIVEKAVTPALKIAEKDVHDTFNVESREDKARYLDVILSAVGVNHLFS